MERRVIIINVIDEIAITLQAIKLKFAILDNHHFASQEVSFSLSLCKQSDREKSYYHQLLTPINGWSDEIACKVNK